jgi:hypothetical protein
LNTQAGWEGNSNDADSVPDNSNSTPINPELAGNPTPNNPQLVGNPWD